MFAALPRTLVVCALALSLVAPVARAQDSGKPPGPGEPVLHVRLIDDSVIKLTLLDERIELITPHGKLSIPVADVRKIELGMRVPDDVARQIQQAAADLDSPEPRKRDAAAATLLRHRERSYPALKQAAKSADTDLAKRAEELIEKLEELVPGGRLEVSEHDVIHTEKSKIAGRIGTTTLRARSFTFGEVPLKLADCRAISTTGFQEERREVAQALPDPGQLTAYQQPQHIGKTYVFRVTGAANGSLWGTGTYTLDSTLAAAAVHAGVLKVGETGNVKVTIHGPTVGFVGTTQNGIASANYANYPGAYQIHVEGERRRR
jgi:LCCL domain